MTANNSIFRCYLCGTELDPATPEEHIIHNFLGGRLKSRKIICSTCNSDTSLSIDNELAKQLIIGRLVDVKRDRSTAQKVAGTSTEGVRYLINPGGQDAEQRPTKPTEFYDENGEFTIEVRGQKAIEEFIKAYKKKHPELTYKDIERKIQRFSDPKGVEVYPDGHGMQPLTNPEPYRAIAKIAANFYALNTHDTESLHEIANFIRHGYETENGVYPFYKICREDLGIAPDETSHIIILIGDNKNQLLYCYIELFNVYNFVVVLNLQYTGSDIEFFYKLNFQTDAQETTEIKVNFNPEEIRSLVFPGGYSDQGFDTRIFAFAEANNLELRKRPTQR